MITAYTDGACSGNPGPGGWGVLIEYGDGKTEELLGGEAATTNNQMELTAAIAALTHLPTGQPITLVTDSTYVKDGITQWIANWKKRGWRTAANKPVKNMELWKALDAAAGRHSAIDWQWVKGHAGHTGNERADGLARAGMAPFLT